MKMLATCGVCLGVILLAGCTGWNQNQTSDAPSSVGAAIAAVFSASQGGTSQGTPGASPMCQEVEGGSGGGPAQVTQYATIEAGTYGASVNSVTVTAEQDCESAPTDPDSFVSFNQNGFKVHFSS